MDNNNSSVANLLTNLTGKQKIGLLGILVIAVTLIGVVLVLMSSLQEKPVNDSNIQSSPQWDSGSGTEPPISTEYSEDFDYHLEEYLPASNYVYLRYGDNQSSMREYWWIMENTAIDKGIVVSVDSCDVEGNTAAANEYLKSLPVDLSDYVIVYQTHVGEVPCDIQ